MIKIRKIRIALNIFLICVLLTTTMQSFPGNAKTPDENPIYVANDYTFSSGRDAQEIPASSVTALSAINSGTVFVDFTPSSVNSANSLISLSNSSFTDAHFHIYIDNRGFLGLEIRNNGEKSYLNIQAPVEITHNKRHLMALTADPTDGYKFYFDGTLAFHMPISLLASWNYDYRFMSTVNGTDIGFIGATYRAGTYGYPYYGEINRVEVYNTVLSQDELESMTNIEKDSGIIKQENVFSFEKWNTNGIRIPSILRTDKGTIIATGDIRFGNAGGGSNDPPNNCDVGVRVSSDNGETWSEPQMLVNFLDYPNQALNYLPKNSASYCDSLLVNGENGRVYFFCDAMTGNVRAPSAVASSGYTTDGHLILLDSAGNRYELHEDTGVVYKDGVETSYTVGSDFSLYKTEDNGEQTVAGNIFYTTYGTYNENDIPRKTELRVINTVFLVMCYSDDGGYTWSAPKLLNNGLKTNDEKHFGTAPGIGIVIQEGKNRGRIIVPIYYNSSSFSGMSGAVLYSDNGGETWIRGKSPNDARISAGLPQVSMGEIQVVEMPSEGDNVSSQLKMFVRQSGGVLIATSYDGGETWDPDMPKDNVLVAPVPYGGCQQSVINYSQPIDGHPAVIFANAAANSRSNGTIRIGLIEENGVDNNNRINYSFNWAHQKVIRAGEFGYSALMEMPNGNIVCFYEQESRPDNIHSLVYGEYTLDYIKNVQPGAASIIYSATDVTIPDASGNYPAIPTDNLNQIVDMHEGTIIIRFTPTNVNSISSLIGISNSQKGQQNSHFHLYFSNNRLGFEIRQQTGGDYQKSSADVSIQANKEYCVAFSANSDYGYQLFLNGQLVSDLPVDNLSSFLGYGFIDNIGGIDAGYLGLTRRNAGDGERTAFQYPFTGKINKIQVFNKALPSDYLVDATTVVSDDNQVYSAKNLTISQSFEAVELDSDTVSRLAQMREGTIIARFTPSQLNSVHSLIGVSNDNDGQQNSHFHLYVASGRIGYEIRRQTGGDFIKSVASIDISTNQEHIAAFVASESGGYKLFFDGELVQEIVPSAFPNTGYGFLSDISGINSAYIGKTERGSGGFTYPYTGSVEDIKVYDIVIPDTTLEAWTLYGGF